MGDWVKHVKNVSFPKVMYQLRAKSGLTLRDAGLKAGVSHTYISIMEKETNKSKPSDDILCALAEVYQCSSYDLLDLANKHFGGTRKKGPPSNLKPIISSYRTEVKPVEDLSSLTRDEILTLIEGHNREMARLLEFLRHMDKNDGSK